MPLNGALVLAGTAAVSIVDVEVDSEHALIKHALMKAVSTAIVIVSRLSFIGFSVLDAVS